MIMMCTRRYAKQPNNANPFVHHSTTSRDTRTRKPVEQLNVECDGRAKRYTKSAPRSSTAYSNPMIPAVQPHLIIGNKTICRNVLTALRQAASVPPYRKELKTCNQWSTRDFDNIDWTTIQSALSSFQLEDQRRIILFIHEKLPLRTSKAHPHHGSQLCPSCQREPEDAKHFLECCSPERKTLFAELKSKITLYTQKIRLHPCIFTTLWLGLATTRTDTPYPDISDEVLPPLQSTIKTQERLGW